MDYDYDVSQTARVVPRTESIQCVGETQLALIALLQNNSV